MCAKHSKGGRAYFVIQFLFEQVVFFVEKCMCLIFCAKLRCQLITLILHPVQLDAQHPTQLLV